MKRMLFTTLLLLFVAHAEEPIDLVACAPGFPSSSEQAQPSMDRFARALVKSSGVAIRAAYTPDADDGRARIDDGAGLALVPAAFFVAYGRELDLRPILGVSYGGATDERWSLVAAKGRVETAADLAGFRVVGLPGYSADYVREVALADFGALPPSVTIEPSGRILSELRRAARGEDLAVLLDTAQSEALAKLPFGEQLEVVSRSRATPGFLLCEVGGRVAPAALERIAAALAAIHEDAAAAEALAEIRVQRFERLEPARLESLR